MIYLFCRQCERQFTTHLNHQYDKNNPICLFCEGANKRKGKKMESNKPADADKYYKCGDCNNAYHAGTINGQIIKEFGICNSCDFLRPQKKETPEFLKREERVIDGLNKSKAASDGKGARYFYVTFIYSVGGKRGYKKGRFCLQTDNGEIFNASRLEKTIRFRLKKKAKSVIIDNWNELNEADYKTLSGGQ